MQARASYRSRNVDDELRRGCRCVRSPRRPQQRNGDVAGTAVQEARHSKDEQRAKQHDSEEQPSLRGRKRMQIHARSVTREASRLCADFLTDDEIDELARDDDRLAHLRAVNVRLHPG